MRNYEMARFVFLLLEFFAWLGVAAGVMITFGVTGLAARGFGASGLVAAIPGIAITIAALLCVAIVQNGRAAVDTAELTQQMLKVARDQLEVSKQALKQGDTLKQGFAALAKANEAHASPSVGYATPKAASASEPSTQTPVKSFSARSSDEPEIDGNIFRYKGQTAELSAGAWRLNGMPFYDQTKLIQYIDQYGIQAAATKSLRAER